MKIPKDPTLIDYARAPEGQSRPLASGSLWPWVLGTIVALGAVAFGFAFVVWR